MTQLLLVCSLLLVVAGFCEEEKFVIKVAKRGNADAQFRLGFYCDWGFADFEANKIESVKWYRKSAELGLDEAQFTLGICYAVGSGVE